MPDTSVYAITYPASTDLVTNGATQMQTISTDVETALQGQTSALSTGFRNVLDNPTFSQNQRPAVTTSVADFWTYHVDSVVGVTNTRNTLAPVAGVPEWVTHYLTNTVASNAAGVARYVANQQTISNVRALANTTVLVSFYAKAATGTPKLGVNLTQNFGTGGSPSAEVVVNGQAVTLTTSWARYSLTFTLASVVGKTFGTNGDDSTILRLWYSAGTNFNTPAGSIGLQTATIDVTGVQVERNYLTPLEIRPDAPNWLQSSDWGIWQDWTPQVKQGAAGMATTVTSARYAIIGKTCIVQCQVDAGSAGTAGQQIQILSNDTLPEPRVVNIDCGVASILDQGVRYYVGNARVQAGPYFQLQENNVTAPTTAPTLASGDVLRVFAVYEIAA